MNKALDTERIRERLLDRLESSSKDRQTGLLSQTAFVQRSERILAHAYVTDRPAALLFADLDHFRRINNLHGHRSGDLVLEGTARLLQEGAAEQGFVCRWGGEEFVILLPQTRPEDALAIAERLRGVVDDFDFEDDAHRRIEVTISVGVALFPRDARDTVLLVERAEYAAYQAKKEGRNRVCVYREPAGPSGMEAYIEEQFDTVLAEEGVELPAAERERLLTTIRADLVGLGPLEPLLADDTVAEIMVDGPQRIYVEREGRLEDVADRFRDDAHLLRVMNALIEPLGRRLTEETPMVDARLADGTRMNAAIPPVSLIGPALTLRKVPRQRLNLDDLLRWSCLNPEMAQFLRACVRARLNLIVAGGAGSGRRQFLNAIAETIPAEERIVVVENRHELDLSQPRVVVLESRPPDIEGRGEVSVRDLVVNALRMRADRIVVGELRAGETLELLQAMNTGHEGVMTTLHAASPRDVLARLEMMASFADVSLPLLTVRQMIVAAIDVIVYLERLRDGSRKVLRVTEVAGMRGDAVVLEDIYQFRETGVEEERIVGHHVATGHVPGFIERIARAGVELPGSVFAAGDA
jgi:pilus assembly protein CpaF